MNQHYIKSTLFLLFLSCLINGAWAKDLSNAISGDENYLVSSDGASESYARFSPVAAIDVDTEEPASTEFHPGNDDFVPLLNNLDNTTSEPSIEPEILLPDDPAILMELGLPSGNAGAVRRVIGADLRQRLYTTRYPARATVQIRTETSSGITRRCSGAMISRNTVLTAGHCIANNGVWRRNVRVFPGQDDNASPFGMCTARTLITNSRWFFNGDSNYDYATIKLNCNVGFTAGWYGVTTQYPTGLPSVIQGYPSTPSLRGEQYVSADKIRFTNSRRIYYKNDTTGGMSGSPVWSETTSLGPYIIGIHNQGSTSYNLGIRINSSVFNFIRFSIDNYN